MAAHPFVRWLSRLLLATLLVALAVPPMTAGATTLPAFRGEYYNNRNLSGAPVLVRTDGAIDFSWGTGSPATGVNADEFSVRWTNFANLEAGTYRFAMRTDDGGRVWVDDALILDRWVEQPATTVSVDRSLGAGYHSIRMEYFEAAGEAVARLTIDKLGDDGFPQWRGEYFNNVNLSGSPVLVRNDTDINFNWGYGSPAAEVSADNFSARWTRLVSFATAGTYTFTATSDDGVRVRVDGTTVIDRWIDQGATPHSGNIALTAGNHTVVAEFYERGGVAVMQLSWSLGGPGGTVVVVDDLDPGFVRGGSLAGFYARTFGYRNHLFWVWNNTTAAYYWGKWTPPLPGAGNYEVQVYIPSRYFGSTSARYRIVHNGTRHDRIVSQARYYDQWVSLGTYYFHAGGGEYVYLASNTGEAYATRHLGFDAVRFIGSGGVTPTPVPGTTPSPTPAACSIMPVLGFGNVWSSNAQVRTCIGCPTQPEGGAWMSEETFEGGYMFWRQDQDRIYALFNDGTWQQFANTWHEGDPETDPSIVPPAGRYQPRRGFGKLWRDNAVVRTQLSWATIEERGFSGSLQPFERGLMIWSPQLGIFALCNDGRWLRF